MELAYCCSKHILAGALFAVRQFRNSIRKSKAIQPLFPYLPAFFQDSLRSIEPGVHLAKQYMLWRMFSKPNQHHTQHIVVLPLIINRVGTLIVAALNLAMNMHDTFRVPSIIDSRYLLSLRSSDGSLRDVLMGGFQQAV